MWNKLFKKKQSRSSNKSHGDATEPKATTTTCFSFRSSKKPKKFYESSEHFEPIFNTNIFQGFEAGHEYSHIYKPEQHQVPEEHQQINEIFIDIPPANLRLDLCPVCSRKFSPDALMKHVIICEKVSTKKRHIFDSSVQRLKGTEFTGIVKPQSPLPERRTTPVRVSPPKTFVLQRKASETSLKSQPATSSDRSYMLNNMSRKNSTVSLGGTPRLKRTVSQLQNEKCPYCGRCFGFKAFERHVDWCKEKALIRPSPDTATVSAAKERMKTRVTYKAPNLKTKRGTTRDKYSGSCNGSTNSLADFDSHLNSMSSSMCSENGGLYDPFLSAKKQLEELFSPTATPTTQMINSMVATQPTSSRNNNDVMTKSLTLANTMPSPKTPQPTPKVQSNFKRTSSLRISNRKTKPVYTPSTTPSSIQCGITDEGPISPNFVKATDYDELPIKSPYSAIKVAEKNYQTRQTPSPIMPAINHSNAIHKPVMRDKNTTALRQNLKLDLKNTNLPSADYSLSKTDSLAVFLKYEKDLLEKMSEKELKDQSNSLSKRSLNQKDNKLPDIHGGKPTGYTQQPQLKYSNGGSLIRNQPSVFTPEPKSHSAPVKMVNACDNLPSLTNGSGSDKSRSPSMDRQPQEETSPSQSRRSGGSSTLRRQMKYNMENILFDTDPEVKSTAGSSDNSNSNNNSLHRPDSRVSNTESIFEDFDFDQFIASFNDDEKFPIFKDYKMMMNQPPKVNDENQNTQNHNSVRAAPTPTPRSTKPISIQSSPSQPQRSEAEIDSLKKLDDLCKMLSGNSDSDEGNSLETDPSESQTVRSKSSADSAYGSLSRHSQSPFDHRKPAPNFSTFKPTPPPPPPRQHLELKTTEIILNPIKMPNFQETVMIPRNGNVSLNRSMSSENGDQGTLSKFCHECGYKFVVPTAKFCIECGVRRVKMMT